MSELKIIKIIISSSIGDIESDILEVKAFFSTLNDIYIDWNIFFSIETAAPDSDESLLESISNSELVFLLFYKKVGDTFRHAFEKTVEMYKGCAKPLIIPYFKYANSTDDVSEDIKKLQDHLGNDLKHYYKSYNNPDTLKLYMIMQIKQMQLDSMPLEISDNMIRFAGKDFVPLNSIPAFANNKHLTALQKKLDEANAKIEDAENKYLSDRSNKKLKEEYFSIISEVSELNKEIEEHKNTLFESIKTIIKETTKSGLSVRQIQAYKLMEYGDYEAALKILDHDVIMSELKYSISTADMVIENIQIKINELLQRIEALKGTGINSGNMTEIIGIYEEIRGLIKKYGDLDIKPLYDYADFLCEYNDPGTAAEIAQEFLSRIKADKDDVRQMSIHNLLGNIYSSSYNYNEAEEHYKSALECINELYNEYPDELKKDLAGTYCNLGLLFRNKKNYDESEKYHSRALEIRQQLAGIDPNAFEPDLAASYNNLGALYHDMRQFDRSEENYINALEIRKKLTRKDPKIFTPDLAAIYYNLSSLYIDKKEYEKAEYCLEKACDMFTELSSEDPFIYLPQLAKTYAFFGKLYMITQKYDQGEMFLKGSIEIKEILSENNNDAFYDSLLTSYMNIGTLYIHTKKYDQAEEYFLRAADIAENLIKKHPDVTDVRRTLLMLYNNIGTLYKNIKRYDLAEKIYLKAEKNFAIISADLPGLFRYEEAAICLNSGTLYMVTEKYDLAEEKLIRSMQILNELCLNDPGCFENDLANVYMQLSYLYFEKQIYDKAEKNCLRSSEIMEQLYQKDPGTFGDTLASLHNFLGAICIYAKKGDPGKFFTKAMEIYININTDGRYDSNIEENKKMLSQLQ